MPKKKAQDAQTSPKQGNMWWVPVLIGVLLLMAPGGVFVAPVMFLMAVVLRRRKKSPETSPSLLFQFTP